MVILHVARCACVTQRTLQNSGQFMRSLEVSATDNVEENIPEYADDDTFISSSRESISKYNIWIQDVTNTNYTILHMNIYTYIYIHLYTYKLMHIYVCV